MLAPIISSITPPAASPDINTVRINTRVTSMNTIYEKEFEISAPEGGEEEEVDVVTLDPFAAFNICLQIKIKMAIANE